MSTIRKVKSVAVAAAAPAKEVVEREDDMESVAESVAESEATESTAKSGSVEEKSPAEVLIATIASMEEQLKQLKKAARAALKGKLVKRTKKDPDAPKAERPAQTSVWSDFVTATKQLMESEGWPSFTTKNGTSFAASEQTEDGVYVFSDTKKKPIHKDAMSYAGFRKANGEYVDPGAEARETAKNQKAAEKAAEKAAKTAEREAAKAAKLAEKEAAKAAKEEEKRLKAELKEAEKAAKEAAKTAKTTGKAKPTAVKAAVAKPTAAPAAAPAKAAGGAGGPSKPSPAASKPVPPAKAAPAEDEDEDEDEDIPKIWEFKKVKYFKNSKNQVWEMKGKNPGEFLGEYNPVTNTIDDAEAPEFEFD